MLTVLSNNALSDSKLNIRDNTLLGSCNLYQSLLAVGKTYHWIS
jgi:hypothetical protein